MSVTPSYKMAAPTRELSEGQYAEVVEGMKLLSRAEKHLDIMHGRLKHCKISIDDDSFEHIRFYLDQIHAQLQPLPLAHAEAVSIKRSKAGR